MQKNGFFIGFTTLISGLFMGFSLCLVPCVVHCPLRWQTCATNLRQTFVLTFHWSFIFGLCCSFGLMHSLCAQDDKALQAQEISLLKRAESNFKQGDYVEALPDYQKLLTLKPLEVAYNFKVAYCLLQAGKRKQEAIPYFEYAAKNGQLNAHLYLAQLYHLSMRFEEAKGYLAYYMAHGSKHQIQEAMLLKRNIQDAQNEINKNQKNVICRKLKGQVNTQFPEYLPLLCDQDSVLFFTARRADTRGGKRDIQNLFFEDIYQAALLEDGAWDVGKSVGPPINTVFHDAITWVNPNGTHLVLYRNDPVLGTGDLYESHYMNGSWSNPLKMGLQINTTYQEFSGTISPDGQTLIFSSDAPGGFGGSDLYVSTLRPNRTWGKSLNMGLKVNSELDEDVPYFSPDGKKLFFASKGKRPNYGGFDLFSISTDSLKTSEAQHLSYPYNTVDDDVFMSLNASGTSIYLSGQREGEVDRDRNIYEANVEASGNFNSRAYQIALRLVDEGGEPVAAKVEVFEGDQMFPCRSSSTNGKGKVVFLLPLEKEFMVKIEAFGAKKHGFVLEKQAIFNTIEREYILKP